MKPHELRVVAECAKLVSDTDKLRTFLEQDRPTFVTELQWDLMVQQYGIMMAYINVLHQRIDTFTEQVTEQLTEQDKE